MKHYVSTVALPSVTLLKAFILANCLLVLGGCSRQNMYENLYEGVRVRNMLQTQPSERGAQQDIPGYHQYRNEQHEADRVR